MVPTMSTGSSRGTKRSKTFDDSDARFYLHDDDANDEDEIQEPKRSIEMNKAKEASTSNTSGVNTYDKVTRLVDTITTLMEKVDSNQEYKQKNTSSTYERLRIFCHTARPPHGNRT